MDDFVELLWDSGTIVLQGQSSCPGASPFLPTPLSDTLASSPDPQEMNEKSTMMNKEAASKIPAILPFMSSKEPMLAPDILSSPARHHDLDHVRHREGDTDVGTVPWINYPNAPDHCSKVELPSNHNLNPPLPPPSKRLHDIRAPDPVQKPGEDDATCSSKKPPHLHLKRGELGAGLMNFSHFLRPVALAKATLQSAERIKSNERASTSCTNNLPLESMVIQSASTLQPSAQQSSRPVQKMPLPSGCQNEVYSNHHSCNVKNNLPTPSWQPVQRNQQLETGKEREKEKEKEKGEQQAVPPASICSINVNPTDKLKRKGLEEDSSSHSDEDVQDESVGLMRPTTSKSTGTKRGRIAEVHNLSERRRRDRINEKMRALQELIPNCNKVDKASMLEEAIEYLKSLQLQLQMMMMMGTGMCVPPMMLSPGLHHMPLAPFPQMPMGMGMRMGMGMGMSMGIGMGYGIGPGDINPRAAFHAMPTPPVNQPLNFMPMVNGAVFPFDSGVSPATSVGPQVNPSNLAQSSEVGGNCTDKTNSESN